MNNTNRALKKLTKLLGVSLSLAAIGFFAQSFTAMGISLDYGATGYFIMKANAAMNNSGMNTPSAWGQQGLAAMNTTNMSGMNTTNMYGMPTTNMYGMPTTNMYGTPTSNIYGMPTTNMYGTPTSNIYGMPTTNMYGTPTANMYGMPTTNMYGMPTTNIYAMPTTNMYGTPTANMYGMPTMPTMGNMLSSGYGMGYGFTSPTITAPVGVSALNTAAMFGGLGLGYAATPTMPYYGQNTAFGNTYGMLGLTNPLFQPRVNTSVMSTSGMSGNIMGTDDVIRQDQGHMTMGSTMGGPSPTTTDPASTGTTPASTGTAPAGTTGTSAGVSTGTGMPFANVINAQGVAGVVNSGGFVPYGWNNQYGLPIW